MDSLDYGHCHTTNRCAASPRHCVAVKARVQLLQEQLQELDELLEAKSFAMFTADEGIPIHLNGHESYQHID